MSLAIKVVVALVIVAFVAVAVLRARKLRRDEIRELSRPVERRLMSPPPSPYTPSKGFRLLDGPLDPDRRPEPPRPRLDSGHEYVFSETQLGTGDELRPASRHDERWALSRSAHHSSLPSFGFRVIVIALVVALAAAFIYYYVHHSRDFQLTIQVGLRARSRRGARRRCALPLARRRSARTDRCAPGRYRC